MKCEQCNKESIALGLCERHYFEFLGFKYKKYKKREKNEV